MTIFRLVNKCPKCGAGLKMISAISLGDPSHIRFDICQNDHRINERDYFDYDKHYVYEDDLQSEIESTRAKLEALRAA